MKQLYLHAVILKKPIEREEVVRIGKDILKRTPTFIHETKDTYRIRNLPRSRFDISSFRAKVVNKNITIIFGHLRD